MQSAWRSRSGGSGAKACPTAPALTVSAYHWGVTGLDDLCVVQDLGAAGLGAIGRFGHPLNGDVTAPGGGGYLRAGFHHAAVRAAGGGGFSRQARLIKLLKIKPKFWAGAEPVVEPQRSVGRDRSPAVNDTSDSIRREVDLPRQLSGRNSKLLQLFGTQGQSARPIQHKPNLSTRKNLSLAPSGLNSEADPNGPSVMCRSRVGSTLCARR
jgi:hypothetical protein